MRDRLYDDDEVAAIFARAAEGPRLPATQPSSAVGLTLAELQQIGREAGIAPDDVARAAQALEARPLGATHRVLGLPIGVERTVTLDRILSEAEWEHLVVRLREAFGARGKVSAQGNLRQWTNGNLQALLEPTPTGHRLRLKTMKGSARSGAAAGAAALGIGSVVAMSSVFSGHFAQALPGIGMLFLMGTGMLAYAVAPLPSWARTRGRQMDDVVAALLDDFPRGSAPS